MKERNQAVKRMGIYFCDLCLCKVCLIEMASNFMQEKNGYIILHPDPHRATPTHKKFTPTHIDP